MTKRFLLTLCVALCMLLLCACQSAEEAQHFQVVTQPTQAAVSVTSAPAPAAPENNTAYSFDDGGYDPASEEGKLDTVPGVNPFDNVESMQAPVQVTSAPTMSSVYAGATPVVIDPIDKPTPSPVPSIAFAEFQTYDATNLSLSFQAPAGWTEDTTQGDYYTITNPDPNMAFKGFVTIGAQNSTSKLNKNQLTSLVKELLSSVKNSYDGKNWSPTKTANRTLLDAAGVYADYSVTLAGGIEVKGRVQAAYLNGKVYTVHMACPAPYFETYKKSVYNKLRDTIIAK